MKFKDLVNQDVVDLTNCEDELIHIPGSIQPHGFFLGLKTDDLTIDFCSGNSFGLSGLTYEQLLGKKINLVLGDLQTSDLTNYISALDESSIAPLQLGISGKVFNCTAQKIDDLLLLEFEPWYDEQLKIADIYQQTKQVTTYMQKVNSLQMLCQYIADETRNITGYDRVMVYRFDEQYNGEVYAESTIQTNESWLNLHYPYTDIPAQARALYLKNLLRIIPDVDYIPSPIYTIDDAPDKNLDLSLSILRSSSPIHIQYLKNIGVAATLTISLIHRQKLWGLIACHHNTPRYINNDVRIAAQLQGHFLTSQISVRETAAEYEVGEKVTAALNILLARIFSAEGIITEDLIKQPELLEVTNASSIVIVLNDEVFTHGNTPPVAEIKKLVNWLHTYSTPSGIAISNLAAVYPDAKRWSNKVSGIIYHSLGSGLSNCILWCRPEVIEEVYWAEDPNELSIKSEVILSPGNSFQMWKEVKRFHSRKWLNPELIAATNFANAFQKHVLMLFLTKEELKQRNLNTKLKEANAELENLYWIGSHDLKEPLRKIQMFASRIMNKEFEGDFELIFNAVKRMNDSAKRMQLLVSDILSYSRLSFAEDTLETVHFNDLIKTVISELEPEIADQQAVISYDTPVEIKGIFSFLQQLLVNLIRNSLKFSKEDGSPHIVINYKGEVKFMPEENASRLFYKITVVDDGIGFDNSFNESIFKVFTRLHNKTDFSGSGVGLALCSKIMKNHNGYIKASGEREKGATFSLYFPKY